MKDRIDFSRKIDQLALDHSQENWNGEGASPVSEQDVFEAKALLACLPDDQLNHLMLFPCNDGSISFDWELDGDSLSVELIDGKLVYAFVYRDHQGHGEIEFTHKIPPSIAAALERFRKSDD